MKPFNLNSNVKVKIKDMGYQFLFDRDKELFKFMPELIRSIRERKASADAEGYTTMQAWVLMDSFPFTGMFLSNYIDPTILIDIE